MMKTKKMIMTAVSLSMAALFALPVLATEAVTEAPAEAVTEAATEAAGAVARASFSIQDYGSGQALTDEQAALQYYGQLPAEEDPQLQAALALFQETS